MIAIDSSAVLAVLKGEPGADAIRPMLGEALISTVNYTEVAEKLIAKGVPVGEIDDLLRGLVVDSVLFDREQALDAAVLHAPTRARGLSLGDRACLALAKALGTRAVTCDRAWAEVDAGVPVQVVGR